jgi:hypothetical protein
MKRLARVSARELEAESRTLELQIKKLDRRGAHITPPEQQRAVELKKLRLLTKDRLSELRRTG